MAHEFGFSGVESAAFRGDGGGSWGALWAAGLGIVKTVAAAVKDNPDKARGVVRDKALSVARAVAKASDRRWCVPVTPEEAILARCCWDEWGRS